MFIVALSQYPRYIGDTALIFKKSVFKSGLVKVVAYHGRESVVDELVQHVTPGERVMRVYRERVDIETGEVFPVVADPVASGRRSKSRFMEYALNHTWDWFVTHTLDPKKHNRYVDQFTNVTQWYRNLRNTVYPGLEYALVPEKHKDGAWHYHALLSGVPESAMIATGKYSHGRQLFVWPDAVKRWGWTTAGRIDTSERAVRYISKYMGKSLELGSIRGAGSRRWSVSAGVERCTFEKISRPWFYDFGSDWFEVASGSLPVAWVRWGSADDAWVTDIETPAGSRPA